MTDGCYRRSRESGNPVFSEAFFWTPASAGVTGGASSGPDSKSRVNFGENDRWLLPSFPRKREPSLQWSFFLDPCLRRGDGWGVGSG